MGDLNAHIYVYVCVYTCVCVDDTLFTFLTLSRTLDPYVPSISYLTYSASLAWILIRSVDLTTPSIH